MSELANVNFKSILPLGKTSNYKEEQKIQFDISADRYGYIDGQQSYIYWEIDNTSVDSVSGNYVPVMFNPTVGIHGLTQRMQLQEKPTGKFLHDVDNYNSYVSIMKSYGKDGDEYPTTNKVERVSAHNPRPRHRNGGDPANHYFQVPASSATADQNIGGNVAVTCSAVQPIHLGLWSGIGDDKKVYPNGAMGGSMLNLFLEKASVALCEMSNNFKVLDGNNCVENKAKNLSDVIDISPTLDTDTLVTLPLTVCNMAHTDIIKDIGYRVGMTVIVKGNDAGPVARSTTTTIKELKVNGGQLEVHLADAVGHSLVTDTTINCPAPTFSYNVKKCELRVLETQPTNPNAIRKALTSGINYPDTQLHKISTGGGLTNQILDLPAVVSRGQSIWVLPCKSSNLDSSNESNSRLYPQLDVGNALDYQWQIRNVLIPNRKVSIAPALNASNDTSILYVQQEMATRPVFECRCFNDGADARVPEMSNPSFVPLLLAPKNSSFNLVSAEPQLRINYSSGSTVPATLYHCFTNHIRRLTSNDMGNDISL